MAWRKWLVRGLVFGVAACGVGAGLLYQHVTDPTAVRQQVVAKLQAQFPGAVVTLDAARLRILGGIVLTELRLVRRDDPDKTDLLYVPSAVVYHDKEHLLDGKMALRKVELHRPRVRLVRNRDGRWNLEGLFAAGPASEEPLPTLVIHQGTFILEDRQAAANIPPLEISDVNLTVVNDPLATVVVDGGGTSETLGAVRLRGTWRRDTQQVDLAVEAQGLPLVKRLVQRLACYCPEGHLTGLEVEGHAEVKAHFQYQPGDARPWSHDLRCRVTQGKLRHPRLPVPLDNLEATVRCVNGTLTLEELKATSGSATLQARGSAQLPHPDQDFRATLAVDLLQLCPGLFERLPEDVKCLHPLFRPTGPARVTFDGECRGGQWVKHLWTLQPNKAALCFQHFPYPVGNITGDISYDHLASLITVDIKAGSDERPITLKGTWRNSDRAADVDMRLEARAVPLDEKALQALVSPDLQKLARSFRATGKADLRGHFRHEPGTEAFVNTYHAHFYDGTVNWEALPYPVEQASGDLDIFPTHFTFQNCQGSHDGGTVWVRGGTVPPPAGAPVPPEQRLIIDVTGKNLLVGPELRKALEDVPGVPETWKMFAPAGRVNFAARIDRPPGQPQDLDLTLDVHGGAVTPQFFPYTLHDVCGVLRYHKNQVVVRRMTARHQRSLFSLDEAVVDVVPGGGYRADLKGLTGNPVLPDAELSVAIPKGLRGAWDALKLAEPFALQGRVVVAQSADVGAQPQVYWDGALWLHKATVNLGVEVGEVTGCVGCQGLYDGYQLKGVNGNALLEKANVFNQPFHDVHANFQVWEKAPDTLLVGLRAPLFGGDVTGQGRVEFGSRLRYELHMTLSQFRLAEFAHYNLGADHQLSGLAAAQLHLTGQGEGVETLAGNGSLDIPYSPTTKLYNLPLLLDLLKFLGLRWPDRTAFNEAHATFNIQGKRLTFGRLDMMGNAVSVWGQGAVNLDGTDVHLDFYPGWARVGLLPPVVGSVPSAVSKNLLKIEVRGKVGPNANDFLFTKVPVPGLIEPLLNLRRSVFGPAEEKK